MHAHELIVFVCVVNVHDNFNTSIIELSASCLESSV